MSKHDTKKTRSPKDRLNITVSKLTQEMISEIRESTDADSDSEAIRNCIRLGYALMKANEKGATIVVENDGERTQVPVFSPVPELV